jgi:hypothetical protein
MDVLAYYTVELPRPEDGWGRLEQLTARARKAAEELTRVGTPVRFLRSIYVPEDETCFHLYQAASPEHVREAARRANLPLENVAVAINGLEGNNPTSRTER